MEYIKNNLIIIIFFYFLDVHRYLQIQPTVVKFLMKDIFGTNILKKVEQKWGTPIYIQLL